MTEPQKRAAWDIISFFASHSADYCDTTPEEWTPSTVEECCLEILPRKITAKSDFFERIAPVLAAFFYYLDDCKLLKRAKKLAETVAPLGPRIVAEANAPQNWGMAKSFMMQAMDEGVDVTNQAALQTYMLKVNERLVGQRLTADPVAPPLDPEPAAAKAALPARRPEHEIGRNAPCPCGSGKKYKKCCGA